MKASERFDQLSRRLADATEAAIGLTLDRRRLAIERSAARIRRAHPGAPPHRLARVAVRRRSRHVAGSGLLSALPATVPGAGTMVSVGAALGDVSYLTVSQVEMVLLLAHLYGRNLDDRDARRLDVLIALGVEAGLVKLKRGGEIHVAGVGYSREQLRELAAAQLAQIVNGRLAAQVAARLARRRTRIVLGREIPVLGIGIAAGYNLWSTRRLGSATIDYLEHTG
ncbi:MAG: hypothetical protein ACTHNU_15940 [Gaiellales bacterium]